MQVNQVSSLKRADLLSANIQASCWPVTHCVWIQLEASSGQTLICIGRVDALIPARAQQGHSAGAAQHASSWLHSSITGSFNVCVYLSSCSIKAMPLAVVRQQELLYHAAQFNWMVRDVSFHGSAAKHSLLLWRNYFGSSAVAWPNVQIYALACYLFYLEEFLYNCEVMFI